MPTRVIMIQFNPDATSAQKEIFQQELKTLADKIPYKKNFHCGFNRVLDTRRHVRCCGFGTRTPAIRSHLGIRFL